MVYLCINLNNNFTETCLILRQRPLTRVLPLTPPRERLTPRPPFAPQKKFLDTTWMFTVGNE